jgi:hypothetical protein
VINRIAAEMAGGNVDGITAEFDQRLHAAGTRPSADAVREHARRIAWIADGNTNE